MKTISSLLMLLCIPLFGNAAYFFAFGGHDGPDCGKICLIFFNISFLCLFLPLLFQSVKDSSYLKGGQCLFSVWYLIIETIIAFLFICREGSPKAALITQFLLLGIFLMCFFGISSMNTKTNQGLKDFQESKSNEMQVARLNLQLALNTIKDQKHRERIRELISEINSTPVHSNAQTEGLERLIREKCSYISSDSQTYHFDEISNLLKQRRTLLFQS